MKLIGAINLDCVLNISDWVLNIGVTEQYAPLSLFFVYIQLNGTSIPYGTQIIV
jgi:hypothetical protein